MKGKISIEWMVVLLLVLAAVLFLTFWATGYLDKLAEAIGNVMNSLIESLSRSIPFLGG